MKEEKNIHSGHRQRMKQRFLEHGLENFDDVNALELLLFYAQPQGDTNPLAHALLDRFGSLDAVLEADAEELQTVSGIKENAAALLKLIPAVSKRYLIEKTPESAPLDSVAAAGRCILPYFAYEKDEVVYAMLLDARRRLLSCAEIGRGVVNAAEIQARQLVQMVLQKNASYVILAHNHLSGVLVPSSEDEFTTRRLRDALGLVGVELSDHLVVCGSEYVSMRECGMMR